MKDLEPSLTALKPALQRRLQQVLKYLRAQEWPQSLATPHSADDGNLPRKDSLAANEDQLARYEAYQWSQRRLIEQNKPRLTAYDSVAFVEDHADQLVDATIAGIATCVRGLIPKEYRRAVLGRERLAQEWPWPNEFEHGGGYLNRLLTLWPSDPPIEPLFTQWPGPIHSATVAEWAESWLRHNLHPANDGDMLTLMKETRRNTPIMFLVRPGLPFHCMGTPALALLYLLEHEVEENQQRKFIAIDTCKEHTKLVEAWRDLPKAKDSKMNTPITYGRVELILPDTDEKRHFQLSLALPDDPLASQVGAALREWRSWAGLRHWVVFQSLLTSNRRLGWVRWTVEEHLNAMGRCKERRRRHEERRAAATMVGLFTQIEIGVYDEKGKLRERRPLVLKSNTYERLVGSQWEIEGLELKVNPLLYRGVRDPKTGELGKNWWPTPQELPYIDHDKFGPAIALGTVLPARWRMELAKSHQNYVDLKGDSLLKASGLPYRPQNLVATWRSVQRNLAELQRRRGLERWEWHGDPDLSTVCRLYAPQWAIDRTAHGVLPKENPPAPTVLTGTELKAWRKKEHLSQTETAARLALGVRTIKRAEAQPDKPLSKKIREAFARQNS
ncbi:MAG: hypothetical protein MJE77_29950 [Proteobacteria bacterium]|nr:hypothetical protein [Pseudomonadota bacterium]